VHRCHIKSWIRFSRNQQEPAFML